MPTLTENLNRPGHFIVREANGYRSRDAGVIASGAGRLDAGAVLGRVTDTGFYVPLAPGASDGSQTAAAILYEGCDARTSNQRRTLIVRECEVHAEVLVYDDSVTDPQKTAALSDLASAHIVAR